MASTSLIRSLCRHGLLYNRSWNLIHGMGNGTRTLFTAEALGINGYEKQRERTNAQFSGMVDKFRDKMKEFATSDTKNMIFTEDLKNMVHLANDSSEDLDLVVQMMKRFHQQNKHLRFGNYVFGPVVMRMFHYLNQPNLAIQVFRDPELEHFFDQLASYQILCDLLYNNLMYQEVLDTFEFVRDKQVQGTKYPKNVLVTVFASCYKLNSVQSYEYALNLLQKMKEVGVDATRRISTFGAALALNQNAPNVALEILSLNIVSNYVTVRNLKMKALSDLGRPEDCLPVLRQSVEFDNPTGNRRMTVCADVLEHVANAIEKTDNKELIVDFEQLRKAIGETGQLGDTPLKELVESEINGGPNQVQSRNKGIQRSFRIGQSINLRPQRNPMYEREKRSILNE